MGCFDGEGGWVRLNSFFLSCLFFFFLRRQVEGDMLTLLCYYRFHGAYTTVLEGEALHDIFGEMDVVAPTLPEMAEAIVAATE